MTDKTKKLTTLDRNKVEKGISGGYVPPSMKVDQRPATQKGYVPPALKPPSAPPAAAPEKGQVDQRPQGGKKTG